MLLNIHDTWTTGITSGRIYWGSVCFGNDTVHYKGSVRIKYAVMCSHIHTSYHKPILDLGKVLSCYKNRLERKIQKIIGLKYISWKWIEVMICQASYAGIYHYF